MSRTTIDLRAVRPSALIGGKQAGPWLAFAHAPATDATLLDEPAQALADRCRVLRFASFESGPR